MHLFFSFTPLLSITLFFRLDFYNQEESESGIQAICLFVVSQKQIQ